MNIMASSRNFRQLVVVRFFRTTTNCNSTVRNFRTIQKLQHCVRAAYTFSEDEIMYAVRTQLRYITRILKWSNLTTLNPANSPQLTTNHF